LLGKFSRDQREKYRAIIGSNSAGKVKYFSDSDEDDEEKKRPVTGLPSKNTK